MSNSCPYGMAQQGNWFIGLSVPPSLVIYDAIAVELSSPMIAGQTYQLSFYQKRDAVYYPNPLAVGYSVNNFSQGTLVDTIPPVTSTNWTQYFVTITPAANAQYITFSAIPITYGWNHLDNLSLTNITGMNEQLNAENLFSAFPNPVRDKFQISFHQTSKSSIEFFNSFGQKIKTLFEGIISEEQMEFDIKDLTQGIYFLKMNSDGNELVKKLIKL